MIYIATAVIKVGNDCTGQIQVWMIGGAKRWKNCVQHPGNSNDIENWNFVFVKGLSWSKELVSEGRKTKMGNFGEDQAKILRV